MPVSRAQLAILTRPLLPILLVALVLGVTLPVAAGEGGGRGIGSFLACDRPVTPPRCTSVGNTPYHFIAFDESLSPELADALRRSMAEDYDAPTKLVMIEQERRVASTDVIAFSGDYGENGAAGWVYCPTDAPQGINPSGDRWCRHQELHLNVNPRYGLFFDDEASRDYVTCHEIGHTLGLHHWGNPPNTDGPVGATCMNADTPNGPTSLHQADIDNINAYPYEITRPRPIAVPDMLDPMPVPRPQPLPPAAPTFLGAPAGPIALVEPGAPGSLRELVTASDAVVRGHVVAVEPGRIFGPATHPFHYAALTVEVVELLAGQLPAEHRQQLVLEVPLFDGPESIERVRQAAGTGERILFLRNKGETAREAGLGAAAQAEEAGFYRLTVHSAEVVDRNGRALLANAGEHASALDRLQGVRYDAAVTTVREARVEH